MDKLNIVSEVSLLYKSKVKPSEREKITCAKDAYKVFKSIEHFNQNLELYECFYAMYLNKNNKILSVMLISEGGTAGTVVDVKKILAPAILQNASSIIVCHNHPSGNTTPSDQDKSITQRIKSGGLLLDCILIDHLIITSENYYSFADENIL